MKTLCKVEFYLSKIKFPQTSVKKVNKTVRPPTKTQPQRTFLPKSQKPITSHIQSQYIHPKEWLENLVIETEAAILNLPQQDQEGFR